MSYIHGGDIYRMGPVLDFSININPLGMPKRAREAAIRGIEEAGRYPDWRHERLISAISNARGVLVEDIIAGNGASELIYAFTLSRKQAIRAWIPAPTFMEYEEAVTAAGGRVISFRPFYKKNEFHEKHEKIPENCDMIFLCNPNNPTGSLYETDALLKLAADCRDAGVLLFLDESFLDFVPDEAERTLMPYVEDYPNLIILRSLTKICGMPGLRLGYTVSRNRTLLREMRRVLQPWNLSLPAEYAGCAALSDREFFEETRRYIRMEREHLMRELAPLVSSVTEGAANFLFFEDEPGLDRALLTKGILIRNCADIRGCRAGDFRIGIRTEEDNRRLLEALRSLKLR